jgi:hypothetical protein
MQENHARRSAFVLRIWQDDDGRTWGQVMEPMTGWRRPFDGVDQLGSLLLEQMNSMSNNNKPQISQINAD